MKPTLLYSARDGSGASVAQKTVATRYARARSRSRSSAPSPTPTSSTHYGGSLQQRPAAATDGAKQTSDRSGAPREATLGLRYYGADRPDLVSLDAESEATWPGIGPAMRVSWWASAGSVFRRFPTKKAQGAQAGASADARWTRWRRRHTCRQPDRPKTSSPGWLRHPESSVRDELRCVALVSLDVPQMQTSIPIHELYTAVASRRLRATECGRTSLRSRSIASVCSRKLDQYLIMAQNNRVGVRGSRNGGYRRHLECFSVMFVHDRMPIVSGRVGAGLEYIDRTDRSESLRRGLKNSWVR